MMQNSLLEKALRRVQKPGRYIGQEVNSVIKDRSGVEIRYAFCFPDVYEIGMSHLGMKILYSLVNSREDAWCERVFAPWFDMEEQMRKLGIELFALESKDALKEFDIIGFTLQYELSYTNVLNMLDLAGLPVRASDREDLHPIVVAGGPCACNPEPLADFIDVFLLGEGEDVTNEFLDLYKEHKRKKSSKKDFLRDAVKLKGVYAPSLYDVKYGETGAISSVKAIDGAPDSVEKRVVSDLNEIFYPESFVVPYISVVHDRTVEEIFRGCIRGCRFCQAGFIYRPIREKSAETSNAQAKSICASAGFDEISLCSLSASDYTELPDLLTSLLEWTSDRRINLSLPSLRIDNFSDDLVESLKKVRRSGLTFAPEAGTQRLRNAINKNINEDEIIDSVRSAFSGGWTSVKLYFMIGLPTETMEDVYGIAELANKIIDLYYSMPNKKRGKGVAVNISVSTFVPKPFTPFQWEPQDSKSQIEKKQKFLLSAIKSKKISVSWHDSGTSFIEAILAKGDRRLCGVIESAWRKGCVFDSWDDSFNYDNWISAFNENGVDPEYYACRRIEFDEILPWDHLDYGIRKEYLISENEKARLSERTENCREKCSACGAAALNGGECHAISSSVV